MYSTLGLLVLTCGPVLVAFIVACILLRFAEKDASWLSFLTCVAGVAIAVSVVAVMPYDVWQALSAKDHHSHSGGSLLRNTWAATYWTTALLSYLLCPILMEFEASGDFTVAARLRTSLRRNAVFYGVYALIMVLLLIILVARGEVHGDLQSWCIAASNAWGLFVLTVLMGFGLVAVPRHFWSLSNPGLLLQDLYRNAVVKDETRLSRLFELQDAVAQARAELAAHVQLEDEGPTAATQRRAFATVSQMTDRCECLHMELSGARMPVRDKGIGGISQSPSATLALHPPPSLARFAEVHRTLKAAALEARRASCCFDSHIQRCIFFEDLEQGDHRAAVSMLGVRRATMPSQFRFFGSNNLRQSLLSFWLRHIRARALLGLGHASCILSAIVVLGQLTLFADGWHLSLLSLFFRQDYGPCLTQAFCLVPLAYMAYTAYFSIFRLKISGWYGLYGNHSTDTGSLLWCASILARLAAPLCYHFLLLIRVNGTTFQAFMGQMNMVPVLGASFNQVFPCLIALLCCCNVFNVYSRFLQFFTLGVMEFEFGEGGDGDDPLSDGKQLVDQERRRRAEECDIELNGRAPFFATAPPAG
ncbi:unnamed protein product [Durusdinium trenchii]|uniref:Uncharacterized protein n=2 Tax=Durusdinium trenchii TaxID=1381693 RepID=A0ABP0ISE4_9DINO